MISMTLTLFSPAQAIHKSAEIHALVKGKPKRYSVIIKVKGIDSVNYSRTFHLMQTTVLIQMHTSGLADKKKLLSKPSKDVYLHQVPVNI
jgi:hypothetical protein